MNRLRNEPYPHSLHAVPIAGIGRLGHLHDDHVAAVAPTYFQVTATGRVMRIRFRRYGLQQLIADGHPHVVQAVCGDPRVPVRHLDPEDRFELLPDAIQIMRDQSDLSDSSITHRGHLLVSDSNQVN